MRLLVDVGVGRLVEEWLTAHGHDVLPVRALNPGMPDDEILTLAVREERLVITMDRDFGELVYRQGEPHLGVVLLRLEDADSLTKVQVIGEIFSAHADELPGRFTVYQRGRLRIRVGSTI